MRCANIEIYLLTRVLIRCPCWVLSIVFGSTHSVIDSMLKFGIHVLDLVLKILPEAQCRLPSQENITSFSEAFQQKYSLLNNIWGVLDGLKLYLEPVNDSLIQNAYYNGWTHDSYIGNLFVFSPDGCIALRIINAPGLILLHVQKFPEYQLMHRKLAR